MERVFEYANKIMKQNLLYIMRQWKKECFPRVENTTQERHQQLYTCYIPTAKAT
jgi:hypothetical protein